MFADLLLREPSDKWSTFLCSPHTLHGIAVAVIRTNIPMVFDRIAEHPVKNLTNPIRRLGSYVVLNDAFTDVPANGLWGKLLQVPCRYSSVICSWGRLGYGCSTISEPMVHFTARLQGRTTRSEEHAQI